MKRNDMPDFVVLMTTLGTLYGKTLHAPLIELYWCALARFEFTEVKAAVEAHVSNPEGGQFMPKPADVIRQLEENAYAHAVQAWRTVLKAIARVGRYERAVFEDALIRPILHDIGGWVALCNLTEAALASKEKEFTRHYIDALQHPPFTPITAEKGGGAQQTSPHSDCAPMRIGHRIQALQIGEETCMGPSTHKEDNNIP